jgi:hypothetical protein
MEMVRSWQEQRAYRKNPAQKRRTAEEFSPHKDTTEDRTEGNLFGLFASCTCVLVVKRLY